MGFHLAILAKINLVGTTHTSLTTPILASLLGPFVFKFFCTTIRPLRQVFSNAVYASRLFLFQLEQITFNSQPPAAGFTFSGGNSNGNGNNRWRRALRLVNERLILARRSRVNDSDEESLRALPVLPL
ncbi:hypothetical protein ACH5RR_040217 [Cinchona calisaya]|uniref:Uncharacterized protein n=1 Tax=Cinchona calisaya TaxID=153742 RepID=A0ABD2XVC9_9GENT